MEGILLHNGISTYVILAAIAVLVYLWVFKKSDTNLPPGPRGWRATLDILKALKDESIHELAYEWARKYGQMTFVSYMGQRLLCLNSAEIVRRLLGSDEFKHLVADRAESTPSKLADNNRKDLVFTTYDASMKKKRRMLYTLLGLHGDGAERFENIVDHEMDRFMSELDKLENKDIELWKNLATSLKIIIYILMLGEIPDDVSETDILEEYDIAFNKLLCAEYDLVLTRFPFLAKIPGRFRNAVNRLKAAKASAEDLLYYNPKKSWIPDHPRGITDLFLDIESKPENECLKNDPEHAVAFLTSLFWTAHLTSRASLLGVFLCLVNHPEVTKKLHEEIDRVVGDRRPKVEDKSNMPYTEATILETLRVITQVPMGGVRTSSADVHIDGVTIPKDTLIVINAWFYHRNEDIFEDPWTFKPERFLDSSGNILPPDHLLRKHLLPFGAGPRSCPGDIFARSRVFMFMTMMLQRYDILPPANEKLVPADFRSNHDEVKGFVRQIQPYKCRLQRRQTIHQ